VKEDNRPQKTNCGDYEVEAALLAVAFSEKEVKEVLGMCEVCK